MANANSSKFRKLAHLPYGECFRGDLNKLGGSTSRPLIHLLLVHIPIYYHPASVPPISCPIKRSYCAGRSLFAHLPCPHRCLPITPPSVMFPKLSFLAALSASILTTTNASPLSRTPTPRQTTCNGNADFCSRIYSNVSWIGTHDSAFVGSIIDPRVNQEESVTAQLDAGIRFLQAQVHTKTDDGATTLEMCHTTCTELDAGSLSTYLTTVKTWLEGHPDAVLTMLLVNGDDVNVTLFGDVFNSTGLKEYVFVPSTSPGMLAIGNWPTYGEMIDTGTRLVVFMDAEANESVVPYVLDEVSIVHPTSRPPWTL